MIFNPQSRALIFYIVSLFSRNGTVFIIEIKIGPDVILDSCFYFASIININVPISFLEKIKNIVTDGVGLHIIWGVVNLVLKFQYLL